MKNKIWLGLTSTNGDPCEWYSQSNQHYFSAIAGLPKITGTPTHGGTYTFIITVTDYLGATASKQYTMTLDGPSDSPAAPTNLSATSISSSQINLSWQDNSSNENGFIIERKEGEEGYYDQIATVSTNVIAYADTGLSPGTDYYYRIKAYNQAGESFYSFETHAMTYIVIQAPSNVTTTIISDSQIILSWFDNSYNEDGFKIERKIGPYGNYQQVATVSANETSYSDTGLDTAMFYGYRITAYNQGGNSHYSTETGSVTHERSFERLLNKIDIHYQSGAINNYDLYQLLHTDVSLTKDFYDEGDLNSGISKLNIVCTEIADNIPEHITSQAGSELYQMAQNLAQPTAKIRGANSTAPAPKYIPYCNTITITGIIQPGFTGSYEWIITKTGTGDVELGGSISDTIITPITQTSITIHGIISSTNQDDIELGLIITPAETTTATIIANTKLTVIQVELSFSATGTISAQNLNDKHDPMSQTVRTDLLGATIPVPTGNYATNGMEIKAKIINITPTSGSQWDFLRDIKYCIWAFTPQDASITGTPPSPVLPWKEFEDKVPNVNDDNNNTDEDLTPTTDMDNAIFILDYPGIFLGSPDLVNAPAGTVIAQKMHAKEWLELKGNRISTVLEWISIIIIRKKANGSWERAGQNEIRALAPGETFTPTFTRDEAIAAMNQ